MPYAFNDDKSKFDLDSMFSKYRTSFLNAIYPVGSIYMSVNSTSPSTLFGGTWERIKDRFLLAAGDKYEAGSEGGESEHTLTIDEMPSHNHTLNNTRPNLIQIKAGTGANYGYASNGSWTTNWTTGETGGGQPHNNMPPYLVVYMWKRTA